MHCSVIWNSLVGTPFGVNCGVRQGGILSPFLFAVYMDDLIDAIRNCGYGLYIGSVFTGALLYADDIALLACSCLGLQKLIMDARSAMRPCYILPMFYIFFLFPH